MITACVAGKECGRIVVLEGLQGSTLVAEIFERFGLLEGGKIVVRCDTRLLKAEVTLAEAGVTTDGMFHVCVGTGGGMPSWAVSADPDMQGIFATSGTDEAGPGPEQGLTEELEWRLHFFSEDVSEIEGALQNLNLLLRSGQHSSSM